MSVEVRRVRDDTELRAARELRVAVFAGEQGVRGEREDDALDDAALHLVAVEDAGDVVGTCRVVVGDGVARLGRLVVRRDARRQGLATALLAEGEREARAAGAREIRLKAQTAAVRVYERAGYVADGEPFEQEGIEHLAMRLELGDA